MQNKDKIFIISRNLFVF